MTETNSERLNLPQQILFSACTVTAAAKQYLKPFIFCLIHVIALHFICQVFIECLTDVWSSVNSCQERRLLQTRLKERDKCFYLFIIFFK